MSSLILWMLELAAPVNALAQPSGEKPLPTYHKPTLPKPVDDPAWHTIDYHKADSVRFPFAARPTMYFSAATTHLSLLDEVGHLTQKVELTQVTVWKHQLHNTKKLTAPQAATLHLHLGEVVLAHDEDPEQAKWHFAQVQQRSKPTSQLYGLAKYDTAVATYYEGAYKQAATEFSHLLTTRPALHGFDRSSCTLFWRHARACVGYHAEREAMGIPEPPKLDPLCGAAAVAVALKAAGKPYDKKTVLANLKVTGRGSTMQDVVNGAQRLGLAAHVTHTGDKGLMALPKPLVAYVEHDHFLSVLAANKKGVSYLCSDCGKWPGGQVNLTWKQWHKLEATAYVALVTPGTSLDDALAQVTHQPLGKATGIQIASAAQKMDHHVTATLRLLRLYKQMGITAPVGGLVNSCGNTPESQHCAPCKTDCPTDPGAGTGGGAAPGAGSTGGGGGGGTAGGGSVGSGGVGVSVGITGPGFGPGSGSGINLGTGEIGFDPPSIGSIFNPLGPTIFWSAHYDSLRGADNAYQNDDFGQGWTQGYNVGVSQPMTSNVIAPQGLATSLSTTALVDSAATFTNHSWEIVQNNSVVATSLSPNGWAFSNTMNNPQVTPPPSAATGSLYEVRQPYTTTTTNNAYLFNVITPAMVVMPTSSFHTLQATGGTMVMQPQPAWIILQNGTPVATATVPHGWQAQNANGMSISLMPDMQSQPGSYQVQWGSGPSYATATLTLVTPRIIALAGSKSIVLSNGARLAFTAPMVPLPGQTAIACTVGAGAPMLGEWDYDATDPRGHFTVTEANRSKWITDAGSGHLTVTYHSLKQILDENGNAVNFVYGSSYGGSHLPLLASITDKNNAALLTITRNAATGNITHVDDRYGRSVYYNVSTYATTNVPAGFPQSQQELDHISQVVPTGTTNPPDRCVLGYQNINTGEGTESVPMMHTITTPSATGSGTQTATINYLTNYGTVQSVVDANGNTRSYSQPDANHTQVTITDAGNNIVSRYTAGYDMNMSHTSLTNGTVDANGHNTQIIANYSYADANNPVRPSSIEDGVGYAAGGLNNQGTTSKAWDQFGNCLTMTSARGTTTTLSYNYANFALGEMTSVQEGTKTPTTFSYYEPSGLIQTMTRAKPGTSGQANQTVSYSYSYDSLGNMITASGPGNNATATETITNNYTSDPTYNYTQTEALGQPLTKTDSLGHVSHYRYDNRANIVSIIDATGHETDIAYNLANQGTSVTFAATGETGTGRAQVVNTFLYPGGPQTSLTQYNEAGTQVYQENTTYGKEGEQLTRTGSTQPVTQSYDALYRLKTVVDGNSHSTQYSYNPAGYLSQISYPNGDTLQITSYDLDGNPLSRTDGRGVVTNLTYNDVESRLTNIAYPASTSLNVAISYDSYGRKSGLTDGAGSQSVNYDDLSNPTNVTTTYTGLAAKTLSYAYNPDGSRSSLSLPDATSYSDTYDAAGRHTGLTDTGGHTFSWTYANNDWLTQQASDGTLVTTLTRDNRGFLTNLSNNRTDMMHTQLSNFALTYASNMSLSSVTSSVSGVTAFSGTTNYTHDTKLQLTQESSTATDIFRGGQPYCEESR